MNISLKRRVEISFILATAVVLILTIAIFYFFNSFNKDIQAITVESNKVSLLTDEIRISAVTILKYQRRILVRPTNDMVDKLVNLCESFTSQLKMLDSFYNDPEVKKIIERMLTYVDSLQLVLRKATVHSRGGSVGENIVEENVGRVSLGEVTRRMQRGRSLNISGMSSVGELADKILESFSDFQDIQYYRSMERDKKLKAIINETKRIMMIVLIIGFLTTIILGLVMPGKIALPFKKIKDAIRELQECNFDVSIYYSQDDEIGEIAREMNKMINSFKVFEELRTDRISVENRKFSALANMVKKPVLVANAKGELIYMNNRLYSVLQVQSEDVIGKNMKDTIIPPTIIDSYDLAIKRRSKIENAEILITARKAEVEVAEVITAEADAQSLDEEGKNEVPKIKDVPKTIYEGYANVIPIRGKDSSLDYYLMVLSTEIFT